MTHEPELLVIDTGPLSHLAEAGWLGILRSVAAPRPVIIPDAVESELRQGLHTRPHLQSVLDATWIGRSTLSTGPELDAFAYFSSLLVAGTRNVGEAAVLAYAKANAALAIIDDRVAGRAAQAAGVSQQGTLGLLCQTIRGELLTVTMVSHLADHLLETEYRLPFTAGGFERWAKENGLLLRPPNG